MRRIFTFTLLLFVLTLSTTASAQFTEADIKLWVGDGPDTAIMVIDFKDGTTDPSFAWGFRYDAQYGLTFRDMIEAVANAEPQFYAQIETSGFLSDVVYNSHTHLPVGWWSTWSGESLEDLTYNPGTSEVLEDGRWYAALYGYDAFITPTVTYPAYDSQWFSSQNVTYWIGEGENESVIVVDFNTENDIPVTYAWGIRYNGTITAEQALNQIAVADPALQITVADNAISSITYNSLSGVSENGNQWHAFNATNMSDWAISDGLTTELSDGKWFGITYGDASARRPFIPMAAVDNGLGIPNNNLESLTVYPNPATTLLNIKSIASVQQTDVINSLGQCIKTFGKNDTALDLTTLKTGVYFLKITTDRGISVQRVIKR